jgi:molecular chaperone DnaK (HSP70)
VPQLKNRRDSSPRDRPDFIFLLTMAVNCIGIYLGTRYSCVGCFTAQGPELIRDGGRIDVPSVVAYQYGEWIVGSLAVDSAARFPNTTICDLNRFLGCSYDMPVIQEAIKHVPFTLVRGPNGEILIEIAEACEIRRFSSLGTRCKDFC